VVEKPEPNSAPVSRVCGVAGCFSCRQFSLRIALLISIGANYGFGAAAGMAQTLTSITPGQPFSDRSSFFATSSFRYPAQPTRGARARRGWCFFALLFWGALAALTGVIHEFWLLALDRFLLGVAESAIFPAMLILLTNWFTRAERSRANAALMLGNPVTVLWMSAVTGFMIRRSAGR